MSNPLEDMLEPCPLDICDGSGVILGVEPWDDERMCPHLDDDDYDPDLD